MTDRDKSSEGFLQRWSRKKTEAEQVTPGATAEAGDTRAPPSEQDASPAASRVQMPSVAAPQPEFDLASLPSLDSITATSDIRAFLMPGVPKELARAALRRAWSADPAIRDFVGLAENAWDFTDPNAMAGFGPLPPGFDVKKLVAELFSDQDRPKPVTKAVITPQEEPQAPLLSQDIGQPSSSNGGVAAPDRQHDDAPEVQRVTLAMGQAEFVQRDNSIATQQSNPEDDKEERKKPRQHGGALPQ
jgi:hypothetical protein